MSSCPAAYHTVLAYLIPEEVRDLFTLTELGFDADFKNTKAAIYGYCEDDVKSEIDVFKAFAGSYNRFGPKSRTYFEPFPILASYQGDNEIFAYIYKNNYLSLMMQQLPFDGRDQLHDQLVAYVISIFLKYQEAKLKGCSEHLPYMRDKIDELKERLVAVSKSAPNEMKLHNTTMPKVIQLITKRLKELCPNIDVTGIKDVYNTADTLRKIKEFPVFYHKVTHLVLVYLKVLNKFYYDEEYLFGLNQHVRYGYKEQIRVFLAGDKKFCMSREILREFVQTGLQSGELEGQLMDDVVADELTTISYEDLRDIWRQHVTGAEFETVNMLHVPIRRTKHRAIFIPAYTDRHAILASDAFLEVLRFLISVKGIFQIINDTNWATFTEQFRFGTKYQKMNARAPLLMDVDVVQQTNKLIVHQLGVKFKEELEAVQEITPIGDEGFDQAALEAQLKTFNLEQAFPNIMEFVPIVFPRIKEGKETLRTTDMYDAVEQCQLLAFCSKFEERDKWLKNHGAGELVPFSYIKN